MHVTEVGMMDDNSFNASIWSGLVRFYEEAGGVEGKHYSFVSSTNIDQMEAKLLQSSESGHSLVVVAGYSFADAMPRVARLYSNQRYLFIDGLNLELNNVQTATFADEQSSFLVGALAAYKAQEDAIENPIFGFIGGMPGAVITRFELGYLQGLQHVLGKEVQVVSYYANDWNSPAKAKAVTTAWMEEFPSLYAIFSAAGSTGNGTIAQVKDSHNRNRTLWAIGVDSDQYLEGLMNNGRSVVLSSTLKKSDTAVYSTLTKLLEGQFTSGAVHYDLANGGVGFSASNTTALSEEVLLKMYHLKQAIIQGDIAIYTTLEAARQAEILDNYTTVAKDGI
jgi:basic membrane protein A and related proteins